MKGKMKTLKVKWLPDTFVVVSLTISAAPSPEICAAPLNEASNAGLQTGAPGKLIIISDSRELRANVATLQ
jgi:hypothetical protein